MTLAAALSREAEAQELRDAFDAAKARFGLVLVLLSLAGVAWWWTSGLMAGMDDGPGSQLGTPGWFLGVWLLMMTAMMFPSVSPTVALYAGTMRRRTPFAPLVFTAGYLVAWTAAGLAAYSLMTLAHRMVDSSWGAAGHWVAAAVLAGAAAYELTPLKNACLATCRSPLGYVLRSWRSGHAGALRMGIGNGAWCIGCCWALMAALFALGVMSIAWMALVAGLIALEKLLPWRRTATWSATAMLLLLAVLLAFAPDAVPGLTIPGGPMS
jgi:predicted metal-binding membrane protein